MKTSLHLKSFVLGSSVTAVSWLRDGNEATVTLCACGGWFSSCLKKPAFLFVTKGQAHGSVCGLCNRQKRCHTSCWNQCRVCNGVLLSVSILATLQGIANWNIFPVTYVLGLPLNMEESVKSTLGPPMIWTLLKVRTSYSHQLSDLLPT